MPAAKPLSKLERVPLREAWKHEAGDFTPWLAEAANLDAAGQPRPRVQRYAGGRGGARRSHGCHKLWHLCGCVFGVGPLEEPIVQRAVGRLPWYHQRTRQDKTRDEPLGCRPPGTSMTCRRAAVSGSDHGLNLFQSKPVDVANCLSCKHFSFKWKPA
jgi:hypothetical protein